jgi:DNA-binding transcriptional LysR family regulator
MDKLRALRYFAAVAETGSFTQAAQRFKVPPSSLSRRIADLENSLGASLLQRTTRLVKLTEIGRQYYVNLTDILEQLQLADEAVRNYQTEPQGMLCISCMTAFGERMLLPLLDKFTQRYPKITLDLRLTDELNVLDRDEVDIAIRGGFAPNERVVAIRLMNNDFSPMAAPDYLRRNGVPTNASELRRHQGLFYRTPRRPTPWLGYVDGQWQDVAAHPVAISNEATWLIQQAVNGRGIIMLPPWAASPYLASGELVPLQIDPPLRMSLEGNASVYLLYAAQRYQIPKIRVAVDFLVRHLRQEPVEAGN